MNIHQNHVPQFGCFTLFYFLTLLYTEVKMIGLNIIDLCLHVCKCIKHKIIPAATRDTDLQNLWSLKSLKSIIYAFHTRNQIILTLIICSYSAFCITADYIFMVKEDMYFCRVKNMIKNYTKVCK